MLDVIPRERKIDKSVWPAGASGRPGKARRISELGVRRRVLCQPAALTLGKDEGSRAGRLGTKPLGRWRDALQNCSSSSSFPGTRTRSLAAAALTPRTPRSGTFERVLRGYTIGDGVGSNEREMGKGRVETVGGKGKRN